MILVEKNNSNEIAFSAVDQIQYNTGFFKLTFKSSMTQSEKSVYPTTVTQNDRYILLDFNETYYDDPENGYISLRGGFYPNGEYTYDLYEVDVDGDELALIETGEMKLMGEAVNPEIQYFFYTSNNDNLDAYVYVTPAAPTPEYEFWNTNANEWQLESREWQNA